MNTALHTFMNIFSADFKVEDETVRLSKIVIPIIQRDYAQGRLDAEAERVRDRFLTSLLKAITGTGITLDFVYGDIDRDGVMTPLDGQQRLTTLFLLHYYAAKKEGVAKAEYSFLKNFSYETRYSARDFCRYLVEKHEPSFEALWEPKERTFSNEIINQAWFPLDWLKDPTISSMLVMLDDISNVFKGEKGVWQKLKDGAISFYFLPIGDMGLTDELYIKMNSRGKPLTQFEHFKAELEHKLREVNEDTAKDVIRKIDKEWTYLLWRYRGADNVVDDEFLRYFRFVCDIICYRSGGTTQGKSLDEFDLINEYFSAKAKNVEDNINKLNSFFNCWCDLGVSPKDFLNEFISYNHESGKIKVETRYNIDIFEDCLKNHAEVSGNGNRLFPLNRIVLLFAIVVYLQNRDTVTKADFARRLRIVNNLIQNSNDEISDSENRTGGNRMPAILKQVEGIVLAGSVDLSIEKALNIAQSEEEVEKIKWLAIHPEYTESLFDLEDHELLQGQISIVGLEHPEYFPRFIDLFKCDRDMIDCALMSIGNYAQQERNGWRHQLGTSGTYSKPWRELFHKSANSGFEETKTILGKLLADPAHFTDSLLRKYAEDYIASCESNSVYDIRYYYIKYSLFRPGSHGKYWWNDLTGKPYEVSVMQTASNLSENTYQPFLKAVDEARLSRESLGQRLTVGDKYIVCENDKFVIKLADTNAVYDEVNINQNSQGIDTEDRIVKFKKWYATNLPLLLK